MQKKEGEIINCEKTIYTVHHSHNSGLIKDVVSLYIEEASSVADVTYGKGVFWKEIDFGKYNVIGSDIKTGIDFRYPIKIIHLIIA